MNPIRYLSAAIFFVFACVGGATAAPFLMESQKVTASDGAGSETFGQSVSVSGNTAVAGAPRATVGANVKQGAAYIYERNAGGANAWGQVKKLIANDGGPQSYFGWSVAINGDTAVVGAFLDGGNNPQGLGSVYIFERNQGGANNWGLLKKIKAGSVAGSFGWSVAINENSNTIVVGASGGVTGVEIGEAFIFDRDQGGANNWGLVRKVTASDPSQLNYFGTSVGISGDTVVAGAPGANAGANSHQGSAYVFQRNLGGANNWGEVKKLNASDGAPNDQFGMAVTVSGDTIAVGSWLDDAGAKSDEGSVSIFERNLGGADNWGEAKKLTPSDGTSSTFYGFAVALSGDRLVVGCNVNFSSAGGGLTYLAPIIQTRPVYLYERNLGGAGNWGELQRVGPVEDKAGDFFGRSVGMSGTTVIGGAFLANVAANVDQGTAYLFDAVPGPNPAIRCGSATQQQNTPPALGDLIAVVSDDLTPPGDLTVTIASAPAGLTVTAVRNLDGKVYGEVNAGCAVPVGTSLVDLQVSDGNGFSATGQLTVNVTANTPPIVGDYPATTVGLGANGQIPASAPPSDNGTFTVAASAPGFNGSFLFDKFTGLISFFNAGPAGNYTVSVSATDACGLTTTKTFALTVLGQGNTITVNTNSDVSANDGACSLREAITSANTHTASGAAAGECVAGLTGTDLIAFNISGAGPHTIAPNSALPDIIEPLIIDGFTQPGAVGGTWPPTLKIVLNGANAGAGVSGLKIVNANNCLIRGMVVNQFSDAGIASTQFSSTTSAANNVVQSNFIGTNTAGTAALGNGSGVVLSGPGNLAGGTLPSLRNLISGNNGPGVVFQSISSTRPRAEGNFIGTDVTGTLVLGNTGDGVRIAGPSAMVGGTAPGAGNLISGNGQNGVYFSSSPSINRAPVVQGNFIGTDVTGTARLGNTGHGVSVAQGNFMAVGGTQFGARNVISANGGTGVRLSSAATFLSTVRGNYIGTDVTGVFNLGNGSDGIQLVDCSSQNIGGLFGLAPAGNRIAFNARDGVRVEGSSAQNEITYNEIFGNTGLGINLGTDGVTPNDPGDADSGPNELQNFPVLTSAITDGSSTTVQGSLNSKADREFTLDFYSNAAADSSGNGEGETWIGNQIVKTDGSGNASFVASLATVVPGRFITATATLTDQAAASTERYGTSEFSSAQIVQGIGVSPASQLLNIATRLRVLNGENVLIGGFIITGTDAKKVMLRAIGPSLSSFFTGVLDDPVLELFQGATQLESNDNWKDGDRTAIEATGIPPSNDAESAIVRTLPPGAYTAIVRGKNNGTGIGLVEAYDLNQAANSKLANISTRGFVDAGNKVMIGGFIVGGAGGGGATVFVRALGPSLGALGIAGALQDPTLELVDGNGTIIRFNNDWQDAQRFDIEAAGLPPANALESALVETLAPGPYTAIVRGKDNITGVGLVEVYNVQ